MDTERDGGVTIDLGAMLRALRRAARPLAAAAGLAALAAVAALSPDATGHVAAARVKVALDTAASSPALIGATVAEEASRLASPELARRVVARPGLALDRVLAPVGLDPLGRLERLWRGAPVADDRAAARLASRLTVVAHAPSPILDVAWTGADAEIATAVVDAVVDEYVKDASARAARPTVDPTAAITETRRRLDDVESRRAVVVDGSADARRGVVDLAQRIESLRAERNRIAARLPVLQRLATSGAGLSVAVDLTGSPLLERLRDRRAAAKARVAELGAVYLGEHPVLRAANAEAADVERQIRSDAARLRAADAADLATADARLHAMEAHADAADVDPIVTGSIGGDADPGRLAREAADLRRRLGDLIDHAASIDVESVRARALGAAAPQAVAGPLDRVGWALRAAALVAFLGIFFVVLRAVVVGGVLRATPPAATPEVEADRFDRVAAELARVFEPAPTVAATPVEAAAPAVIAAEMPSVGAGADAAASFAAALAGTTEDGAAAAEESVLPFLRGASGPDEEPVAEPVHRVWARLAEQVPAPRRIVVVSADAAATAHRAALALLRAGAIAGETVCAVDLAAAEVAATPFGRGAGLADLLDGSASYGDVIVRDRVSRGHLIGAGSHRLAAAARRGADLARTLEALERVYDRLILDLGVADTTDAAAALIAGADVVILADGAALPPAELRRLAAALTAGGAPEVLAVTAVGVERRPAGRAA
ncbi:hypothetical protein EYW49_17960 [Siculibacillus lacustris]|uniref:Polysaccharide chain length determinant N-terminal domain-containing protein n=1 Tax=Siculibacillus lacustris TaxID=1549641 RepID=A0A4Q9VHK8_9HYPH|nr:hypothetical protein [Siculibacillus lacustris]TBW34632.1 hypothetical protein EYW49_17960 [Siculibacillus lacustris]